MNVLEVSGLVAGYGKIEVLHGVSFSLAEGTLGAIVGANGAGKTTLLMALSGLVAKRAGTVVFDGVDV
ncbi:MAG TPA: ATP-binding cassette domain-containing protein, partial [Candidatus Acidoferrales bacterium]|nr:ATP-binding cassette domain-containing protein [Candidatus Acidoferrales bacterium]